MSTPDWDIPLVPENVRDPAAGVNLGFQAIDEALTEISDAAAPAATALQPADIGVSVAAYIKNKLDATANPGVGNDSSEGYAVTSKWVNTSTAEIFLLLDQTDGAAVWGQATLTLDELGSAALADVGAGGTDLPDNDRLASLLDDKVDKVSGKQLSTEDYTTAEKDKLTGIATAATANATDAQLRDRSTHTGVQAQNTVTGLEAALAHLQITAALGV